MEKPEISSREDESRSARIGRMAEWSKALALGASPKGRGFEPHFYHTFSFHSETLAHYLVSKYHRSIFAS